MLEDCLGKAMASAMRRGNGVKLLLLLLATMLSGCVSVGRPTDGVDLAILNGTVVDGTGAPARRADILIRGDEIVFVGRADRARLQSARIVDAAGRYVVPGFIDNHAHGNPLLDQNFENFLRQGVTTVVLGQDGVSPQDVGDRDAEHGIPGPATLAQWMQAVDAHGVEVNVAALSGHGTNRMLAGGRTEAPLTPQQRAAAAEILRGDLAAGAFGLSSGLEYVPGRYASTEELAELAEIVGAVDGVVMSHMRSEDDDRIAGAIAELIEQGRHARVNISHIKIVFGRSADQAEAVLRQIREARAAGIRISADVYPYLAGYGDMTLVYPSWAKRRDQWEAAVRDRRPELEAALIASVNRRNGPGAILIGSGPYAGKTLEQVARELNRPFVEVLIDVFGFGGPGAAHRMMAAEVQDRFIADPDISISTDGGPWINHPRSWGTYPTVLGYYVRDRHLITMEAAIRKMTSLPASVLGLRDRGVIAVGRKADLVVFDPTTIRSNATWENARQAPTGIDAVIVNGAVALSQGQVSATRHGHVLRRPEANR